jgi:hypothetical protein
MVIIKTVFFTNLDLKSPFPFYMEVKTKIKKKLASIGYIKAVIYFFRYSL